MSDAAVEKILAELAYIRAELARAQVPLPILTTEQAMALANCGSASAFQRWCATWRVKPCGRGRYSRRALHAALEREANSVIRRRRTPEPKEAHA